MLKQYSFPLLLRLRGYGFGTNFFLSECFVQVTKATRTTIVHYVGIFL